MVCGSAWLLTGIEGLITKHNMVLFDMANDKRQGYDGEECEFEIWCIVQHSQRAGSRV